MIARVNDKDVIMGAFDINHSLLYALKSITGDSENEIVKYFYELGIQLFNDCIKRKKMPNRCNRTIRTFYKDTTVQVKFEVQSNYFTSSWAKQITIGMKVSVPNNIKSISGEEINRMLTETGLGLSDEQVLTVEKPQERLYRCLTKKQQQ